MEKNWVVCIRASGLTFRTLIQGKIYEIKGFTICNCGKELIDVGVPLTGCVGSICSCGHCFDGESWFNTNRFREVDSVGERVCESIERQPVKQLA